MSLEKVNFQMGIPVDLALKWTDGKEVNSQFGPPSVMFTTTDDRVMFLPPAAANRVRALGVEPGEPLRIVKGRKDWEVSRLAGEQKDGTFAIPKEPARLDVTGSRGSAPALASGESTDQTPVNGHGTNFHGSKGNGREPDAPFAARLREQVNTLIDVQESCVEYAKKAPSVRPDDVRAMVLTAFIGMTKGGARW